MYNYAMNHIDTTDPKIELYKLDGQDSGADNGSLKLLANSGANLTMIMSDNSAPSGCK